MNDESGTTTVKSHKGGGARSRQGGHGGSSGTGKNGGTGGKSGTKSSMSSSRKHK